MVAQVSSSVIMRKNLSRYRLIVAHMRDKTGSLWRFVTARGLSVCNSIAASKCIICRL
jgi:hypothetical protein